MCLMRKTFAGIGKNVREQKRGQRLGMVAVESVYKNTKGAPLWERLLYFGLCVRKYCWKNRVVGIISC